MPINPNPLASPDGDQSDLMQMLYRRLMNGDSGMIDTPDALNARRMIAPLREWNAGAPGGGERWAPPRNSLAMFDPNVGGQPNMLAPSVPPPSQEPRTLSQQDIDRLWQQQPTDGVAAQIEQMLRQNQQLQAPWDRLPAQQ